MAMETFLVCAAVFMFFSMCFAAIGEHSIIDGMGVSAVILVVGLIGVVPTMLLAGGIAVIHHNLTNPDKESV